MKHVTHGAASVLLVDDDTSLLRLLSLRLEGEGYSTMTCETAHEALKLFHSQSFDLVLSDLRMPGLDGLAFFDEIMALDQTIPVILMTAHGTIEDAVDATQRGVAGFITKPIEHEELRALLNKHLSIGRARSSHQWRQSLITQSNQMEQLLEQAYRVAQRNVSVLISGESGTGKELLAKAIHQASDRATQPFVAINCGALPENLLESELFGHTKGAFTGAISEHRGLFREADGGTLFLDEIGDMPLPLQVKLLRVLQEQQIRPVGSNKHIDINVRILSATHKNLRDEMQQGNFREDLFYRLNVVNLQLPSLQERAEDIPLIAKHLLKQSAQKHQLNITRFSDQAMQKLVTAKWPGNVRQLVNVIEQCVAFSQTPVISEHLVKQALFETEPAWPTLAQAKDAFEQRYLVKVLKMTEGNVTRAAQLSARNRTDMHKLMKKHNLLAADFKADS